MVSSAAFSLRRLTALGTAGTQDLNLYILAPTLLPAAYSIWRSVGHPFDGAATSVAGLSTAMISVP